MIIINCEDLCFIISINVLYTRSSEQLQSTGNVWNGADIFPQIPKGKKVKGVNIFFAELLKKLKNRIQKCFNVQGSAEGRAPVVGIPIFWDDQ